MKTNNVLAKCIAIMCAVVWSGVGSVGFAQPPSVSPEKNIAEDMGELHNKGVYEFMEYLKNQVYRSFFRLFLGVYSSIGQKLGWQYI